MRATLALLVVAATAFCLPAWAQAPTPPGGGDGSIVGRVFDSHTGDSADGVKVSVIWPTPADGSPPREEIAFSDEDGHFSFPAIPAGSYRIRFEKEGFRDSLMTDFRVAPGQPNRADFPIPPLPPQAAEEPPDIEEFVVVASPVAEILAASRLDADEMINTMDADEFSKLAIGDVADALKFVPGVNVVEGQFAVIRGLEDRYSSTLYNFAPVPSPDPDRQSVQLDLFPSDIVSNLVVAKTFGADLPSNSSAGSINIITHEYPEEFELKLNLGGGYNDNAWGKFLEFESGSPIGKEEDGWSTLESDYGASFGGRSVLLDRELRFKGVINNEIDYETGEGYVQQLEPRPCSVGPNPCAEGLQPTRSGDLALGELFLSNGKYQLTESDRDQQFTAYGGLGFDLDESGYHKIDLSTFYTSSESELVQLEENGYLPNFDYSVLAERQANGDEITPGLYNDFATISSALRKVRTQVDQGPERGPLWFSSFAESESFDTTRELTLYQINGDHQVEAIEGLHLFWAANHAKTTQNEKALSTNYFFEPADPTQVPTVFPVKVEDLGEGQFAAGAGILKNTNDISEDQDFGRLGVAYTRDLTDALTLEVSTGGWWEYADRDVTSTFVESPTIEGSPLFAVLADTEQEMGKSLFEQLDRTEEGDISFTREGTNSSKREIEAWDLGSKATLWQDIDLLTGFRLENIYIQSLNDPFTGESRFGAPATFPETYLFFDRLDNPARGEVLNAVPESVSFNDEVLGIDVPIDPDTGLVDLLDEESIQSLVNGEIDETKFLPSLGFTYRPIEGLNLRGAWSETVARPSFREMGFYVSVEPGTDDLVVGNPQLGLSDVESYDLRAEYSYGEAGDLAALSLFYKTIQDPIESIVIRNPLNAEASSSALWRTFFNNNNEATVQGLEVEARKNLAFLGFDFAQYFSIGGNYTYIDAEVGRSETELERSVPFFGVAEGDTAKFVALDGKRRLFGQPEWIANADISFDHPDWGTKVTLAWFGISDILDAAGSAFIRPDGVAIAYTPDRYIDSYDQLDLIVSQRIWRGLSFKASVKNLTDSRRRVLYDPEQTSQDFIERSYKVGLDYSFSLTYTFEF